ncbi:MAG: ribulokinase, partial [Clostridia bacterium]|nr:ribulokinase [Clostridia bacterium]
STCHILLGSTEKQVPGMCGVVEDGVMPGLYGYEAGQCCVGDSFQWFIENCLPESIFNEAKEKGVNVHKLLREKCSAKRPGESGLIALDWFNSNRSVLCDIDLTGVILGMTLQTKPEDIYRALIESTAYGTRMIVDTFNENGVKVNTFYAAGGISQKDPMTMQIYSDVLNMPVKIAGTTQCGSLGSAILGAVAAGKANGGYDDVYEAAGIMGKVRDTVYYPNPENVEIYNKLYAEYKTLHDYFGRGTNDVMKRLKKIAAEG